MAFEYSKVYECGLSFLPLQINPVDKQYSCQTQIDKQPTKHMQTWIAGMSLGNAIYLQEQKKRYWQAIF